MALKSALFSSDYIYSFVVRDTPTQIEKQKPNNNGLLCFRDRKFFSSSTSPNVPLFRLFASDRYSRPFYYHYYYIVFILLYAFV